MSEHEYRFYVGVDWGNEAHQICILDRDRRRVAERVVPHTAVGLGVLGDELSALAGGDPACIAVALEVPRGAVVDALLERGVHVFALNPKQLDRFRDRHTVAGAKDDRRDAFVLADSLRTDRPAFRRVQAEHPLVIQVRELSRLDDDLRQALARLSNRLREQLHRFFPQALALCPAADEPWFWALLGRVPTPADGQRLSIKAVRGVLKTYRIRRVDVDLVRTTLQAPALRVAAGTVEAATTHVTVLLPQLHLLHDQRDRVGKRLDALLEELAQEKGDAGEPADVAILQSLPGVGRLIAATIVAEGRRPARDLRLP